MAQGFQELRFLKRLGLVVRAHHSHVDRLHYAESPIGFAFYQVGFAKTALAQESDFVVSLFRSAFL
jgi:hypothetical protein